MGTARSLDQKVTLDLDGAAFPDVVKTLEELSGCKFAINSRGPVGPITLNVQNVRFRTALDAICDGLGGAWHIDAHSNPLAIRIDVPETSGNRDEPVTLNQPITLRLVDADIRDVLHSCAKLLGARLEIRPGVCGSVSADIEKTPVSKFLDEICRQGLCGWRLDRSAEERVLRVAPASPRS